MKTLLVLLFFFAFAQPLQATIYKGTIGDRKAYVELDASAEKSRKPGRFFFTDDYLLHRFTSWLTDDSLVLTSTIVHGNQPRTGDSFEFHLKQSASGLAGIYISRKDTVEVHFTAPDLANEQQIRFPDLPFHGETPTDFEAIHAVGFNYISLDTITVNPYGNAVAYFLESRFHTPFALINGYAPKAEKWANELLLFQQCNVFAERCINPAAKLTQWNQVHREPFFSAGYFIDASTETTSLLINLDIERQRVLFTEDLLRFEGYTDACTLHSDAWRAYREQVFGPKILSYIRELYPDDFTSEEDSEINDPKTWMFCQLAIGWDGFEVFSTAFSQDEPKIFHLPYTVVAPFLVPEYTTLLLKH